MSKESKFMLSDFVTPIGIGLDPAPAPPGPLVGRLSDERTARVNSRVRALEAARQQAEAESRVYYVR